MLRLFFLFVGMALSVFLPRGVKPSHSLTPGGIAEELEQSKGPVKHEHHPVLDAVGQCSMDIESDRATVCLYGASADQVKNTICSQISKKMCTAREASTLWRLLPNKPFVLVHFNPM